MASGPAHGAGAHVRPTPPTSANEESTGQPEGHKQTLAEPSTALVRYDGQRFPLEALAHIASLLRANNTAITLPEPQDGLGLGICYTSRNFFRLSHISNPKSVE